MKPTLFIHIPRTAGSSMRQYIKDVVPDFKNTYDCCRNRNDSNLTGMFLDAGHVAVGNLLARKVISREWYDECFRFTFVRNPWDRLVSVYKVYYHYRWYRSKLRYKRKGHNRAWVYTNAFLESFETFVRAVVSGDWLATLHRPSVARTLMFGIANPQMEWLRWGVDFVGRYENLDEDWKRLCSIINIPYKLLPVTRTLQNVHWPRWSRQEWYVGELQDLVSDFYAEEIERFEYTFDE